MKHMLVVDDEKGSRDSLAAIFSKEYLVSTAESADSAMEVLTRNRVDIILLDVIMPEKGGLAFLEELRGVYPDMPVVMVSASPSVRPVVAAIRGGACDYVQKPFDVEEIRNIVQRALDSTNLHRRVRSLETEVAREFPVAEIIGESPAFLAALAHARKAAEAESSTVLITGESGTGKELVARFIHAHSTRRDEPFVAINCAAVPEPLLESELFGYEKGAFTGADRLKPGRFDIAGSGTLFFDEVSEMSPAMQVKLLRVLQEREFMRVGGTRVLRTNVRIVAATAKDLRKLAREGRFRDDLYYRIGVVPIVLPPLRERTGDIPLLARHFLKVLRTRPDIGTEDFAPAAMGLLCRYGWPGNARELRNIVERMLVLHGREPFIGSECLPEEFHEARPEEGEAAAGGTLEDQVSAFEKKLIERALRETDGVQTRAAQRLGTTRRILRYHMEKLGIPVKPGEGGDEEP